jgi:hypothetical protein
VNDPVVPPVEAATHPTALVAEEADTAATTVAIVALTIDVVRLPPLAHTASEEDTGRDRARGIPPVRRGIRRVEVVVGVVVSTVLLRQEGGVRGMRIVPVGGVVGGLWSRRVGRGRSIGGIGEIWGLYGISFLSFYALLHP